MSVDPATFLRDVLLLPNGNQVSQEDVYVTLTFAQSVDAKIAGKGGKQLILSGKESMFMTHWMRSMHDAILIGIETALNDDPQLNVRLLPSDGGHRAPQPIIMDSCLRFRPDCKLIRNFHNGGGRKPWVVTSAQAPVSQEYEERRRELEKAGVRIIEVEENNGRLSINSLLQKLVALEVKSLMVEGGARVISSFLNSGRVDNLVITVAPTVIGHDGVGYGVGGIGEMGMPRLDYLQSLAVGRDTVMAWRVARYCSALA